MKKELIITSLVVFVVGALVAGVNYFVVSSAAVETWAKIDEGAETVTAGLTNDQIKQIENNCKESSEKGERAALIEYHAASNMDNNMRETESEFVSCAIHWGGLSNGMGEENSTIYMKRTGETWEKVAEGADPMDEALGAQTKKDLVEAGFPWSWYTVKP